MVDVTAESSMNTTSAPALGWPNVCLARTRMEDPIPPPSDSDAISDEARGDRREKPRPYRPRQKTTRERVVSRLRELGPGLITGAADDDPSGIATYSQAGAAFGYGLLWTALISLPLMSAIQLLCARIGIVARSGLAA